MKRAELLQSNDFWIGEIQNELYAILEKYMQQNNLNRTQLAQELNVTKGYVTQVLSGDFDHKLSKLVALAMHAGKVPLLFFEDREQFIKNDSLNKVYELVPVFRNNEFLPAKQTLSEPYAERTIRTAKVVSMHYQNQPSDSDTFEIRPAII